MAPYLHGQGDTSLRNIAGNPVITTGKKKGRRPSPATVMRMLREHVWFRGNITVCDKSAPSSPRRGPPGLRLGCAHGGRRLRSR